MKSVVTVDTYSFRQGDRLKISGRPRSRMTFVERIESANTMETFEVQRGSRGWRRHVRKQKAGLT